MGAGAWGTALAKVLADAGNDVTLWARRQELADEINTTHRNPEYLGDVELPNSIRATSDAAEALAGACTVLLAVPSQTLRANLTEWAGLLGDDVTLVSLAKGIELDTLMRMSQVVIAGDRRRPVPGGRRHRSQPGQRDRRGATRGHGRRLRRLRPRGDAAAGAGHQVLPSVHQRRRHRRRGRRRMQERHRVGLRHGGGCRDGRELGGGDHHPRAGRDHAAGNRVGRQARHAGRPRRSRRPRRDLHVAALAQPHVRCTARRGASRWKRRSWRRAGTSPRASRRANRCWRSRPATTSRCR